MTPPSVPALGYNTIIPFFPNIPPPCSRKVIIHDCPHSAGNGIEKESMMKLTREVYRPNGVPPIIVDPELGIEVYAWSDDRAHYAKIFSGKRAKPDVYYRYNLTDKGLLARNMCIEDRVDAVRRHAAEKKAKLAAKKIWRHGVVVGDIFRASWGYDQTNIDYYQVTALIGEHFVEVRKIGAHRESNGLMLQGVSVPVPGKFLTEPDLSRPQINGHYPVKLKPPRKMRPQCGYNGEPYLSIASYALATLIRPTEVAPGVKVFAPDHWTAYA